MPRDSGQTVRFAAFELDLASGELRRSGVRLPVHGRPLQVLAVLVRTPDQIVTTDQLRAELWPADTFVDFEHGVRNAVARLRAVLDDTADRPRYIETLPRRGYRFIGTLAEAPAQRVAAAEPEPCPLVGNTPSEVRHRHGSWRVLVALCSLSILAGAGTSFYLHVRGDPANVQIKSLAVLPLENLSGDPAQDYFADGVTDELITALARMNSVQVISRRSAMRYKGVHNKSLPQIARELGADAVVEGTLVRSGDRVRVTAQLIEAATDRHLWAERYERSSRDIVPLENDISTAIANRLEGKLNLRVQRGFDGNAIDPAAHEAYLHGLYLWNRRTRPALLEARRYFSQAIEKEPRYAAAYAARAAVYNVLASWAFEAIPPQEAVTKATPDCNRALELDGNNAEAHAVRASILWLYDWDAPHAEIEFQRAIELSPSYTAARQWYGAFLCTQGRFEHCLAETAHAHALDPAYLIAGVDVGTRLYEARRYTEAFAPIQKVLEFNPDFMIGHLYLGQVYEATKMYPQARVEFQKAVELSGDAPAEIAAYGHACAASGDRNEARKALRRLDELAKQRYVSGYEKALIRLGLGEKQAALGLLQSAFRERSSWMTRLDVDPRLDPLREDARFTDLRRRVGLTP